jgi:flagellar hook protein FlgE
MSIVNMMSTGTSGIAAEGMALGIAGDNIANVNTVGFKSQRVIFGDMLGRVGGGTSSGGGAGVRAIGVQNLFTQGSLSSTGVATDLAIEGDGFFCMKGVAGGVDGTYYSRGGQFRFDKDGYFTSPGGLQVQGYKALGDGRFDTNLTSLQVNQTTIAAKATTKATIVGNLDASATPPAAFDPASPNTTSNFSTTVTVYDSLGKGHPINVYFRKTSTQGQWEYNATTDGGEVTGGVPGTPTLLGGGTLNYNTNGALDSQTVTTPIVANFANAKPGQALSLNFGSPITPGPGQVAGTGLDGMSSFAVSSTINTQDQDGTSVGELQGFEVDPQGTMRGLYSNGQKVDFGTLALAKFPSNDGLSRMGNGLWAGTDRSGEAVIGLPKTGGRGMLNAGSLEQSNVDLAQQFVELIGHQRAFQANSKTITTADDLLQEIVNLKR